MQEMKIVYLKQIRKKTMREKVLYWKDRSERTDNRLLHQIAKDMNRSINDPKVRSSFQQTLPPESKLKCITETAHDLKLPLNDAMVLCRYWRTRTIATSKIIEKMRKKQQKRCFIQKREYQRF